MAALMAGMTLMVQLTLREIQRVRKTQRETQRVRKTQRETDLVWLMAVSTVVEKTI